MIIKNAAVKVEFGARRGCWGIVRHVSDDYCWIHEIDDLATLRQIWSTPSGQAARLADEKAVEICRAAQAAMDSTADRSAFVDMPWVPPELQEIVNVTFGCTPEERS